MKVKRWWLGSALLLAPLTGCGTIDVPDPEGQRRDGEPLMNSKVISQNAGAAKSVATSLNQFGLQLLATTGARTPGQNVFLSPMSAWLALAMVRSGASGRTKAEFSRVLEIRGDPAKAITALRAVLGAQGAVIQNANAIWADRKVSFSPTFVSQSDKIFGAKTTSVDFEEPASVEAINSWVKERTAGEISDLIQGLPTSGAVLTNALYFRGRWRTPFNKESTQDAPFHLPDGTQKSVPMMVGENFQGVRDATFEGVILPYRNSTCELWALLPSQGQTPLSVVKKLSAVQLKTLKPSFNTYVRLPRFSVDWGNSLAGTLKQMGLQTAFIRADLQPMGLPANSRIADVQHKTRLEIDEEGSVAAAATAVTDRAASEAEEPKILVFDRPFVLLLRETKSGALLFAGIVNDPQPLP